MKKVFFALMAVLIMSGVSYAVDNVADSGLNGRIDAAVAVADAKTGNLVKVDGIGAQLSVMGAYATKITTSGDTTYIAIAPIGSAQNATVWQARNITVSGATTTITWAGSGAFNQTASNLTALTYN